MLIRIEKAIILVSILLFASSFLAACASPHAWRSEYLASGVGTYTQTDVVKKFGPPDSTFHTEDGSEVWRYRYSEVIGGGSAYQGTGSSGMRSRCTEFIVTFSAQHVLQSWSSQTC